MNTAFSKAVGVVGLMGLSTMALAGEPSPSKPQEPIGFVTGGVIGAFAAGPVGAAVGAGLGAWLGNRVRRAGEATRAEANVVKLQIDKSDLQMEKTALLNEKVVLTESNQSLSAQLNDLTLQVQAAKNIKEDGSGVLDGLQGDVLFRTGSAEITPETAHQVQVLAQAVAKSPSLKVRVDGYADPRGTEDDNMKLSQARADAVRDLFLAAGINEQALEVNAYGDSQSAASDDDGYALERRVRLTLQAQGSAAVAQANVSE